MRETVLHCTPRPDVTTEIRIGAGNRADLPRLVEALGDGRSVVALLDESVAEKYQDDLVPPNWRRLPMPAGESSKSLTVIERTLRQMAQWQLDRRSIVVAIGGGAVGDAAGLAASLFLRGVELVQVPTTLLAMLDSSVGGKTAINIPEGKNLIGTFWPPSLMLADVGFVTTLPHDQLRSGLGEALKMGIGFDRELFELLEINAPAILDGDPDLLVRIVSLAVAAKIATVEADPFETTGQRRRLNLGHTLAHALEAMSGFTILHGLAVGQGLHFALQVAADRNLLDAAAAARCRALLELYGFHPDPLPGRAALLPFFSRDKKMDQGQLHLVLPTSIGACATFPVAPEELLGGSEADR